MSADLINNSQTEMQAFERGRIAGELEASRRMEAEQQQAVQLKQPLAHNNLARPDVVEINRLTDLQRIAFVLGELTAICFVVLTIVWLDYYRGDVGWSNDYSGDNHGDIPMFNTHILTSALGLFFLAQAISNYRILPLNLNPNLNRLWYTFMQCCAFTCFIISLVATVRSTDESTWWSVNNWCYSLGLAVYGLHALYSMFRCWMPVNYGEWTESRAQLFESPEQARDKSDYNQAGRTVYAPAPINLPRQGSNIPAANQNVGAEVPVAPANAPRYAVNPDTHEENYFLMPRAKWAVVGFWAMGASILMDIAAQEQILATGHANWAQDNYSTTSNSAGITDPNFNYMNEQGPQQRLIGTMGLMILLSLIFISYMAMPPRTTLVKNGVLVEQFGSSSRRTSLSAVEEQQQQRLRNMGPGNSMV